MEDRVQTLLRLAPRSRSCRRCLRFQEDDDEKTQVKRAGDSIAFIESLMQEMRADEEKRWPFLAHAIQSASVDKVPTLVQESDHGS